MSACPVEQPHCGSVDVPHLVRSSRAQPHLRLGWMHTELRTSPAVFPARGGRDLPRVVHRYWTPSGDWRSHGARRNRAQCVQPRTSPDDATGGHRAAIDIAVASALSRVLSSVLFGVSAADPIGLGGGALLVLSPSHWRQARSHRPATRPAWSDCTIAVRGQRARQSQVLPRAP
jgi:hypothetical protein